MSSQVTKHKTEICPVLEWDLKPGTFAFRPIFNHSKSGHARFLDHQASHKKWLLQKIIKYSNHPKTGHFCVQFSYVPPIENQTLVQFMRFCASEVRILSKHLKIGSVSNF